VGEAGREDVPAHVFAPAEPTELCEVVEEAGREDVPMHVFAPAEPTELREVVEEAAASFHGHTTI
jgi:hypothetical protein